MQVILLKRVAKLGQMGDVVAVKAGFARNYLLPQGKALRANKANLARFEKERVQLEAHNLELRTEAKGVGDKLQGQKFIVIRQAGDSGQLYGSVSTRDISDVVSDGGFSIERKQVLLDRPIKALGLHEVRIGLHPEVEVFVSINVARSAEEAERQARGEDVSRIQDEDEVIAEDTISPEEVFQDDVAVAELSVAVDVDPMNTEETNEKAGDGEHKTAY